MLKKYCEYYYITFYIHISINCRNPANQIHTSLLTVKPLNKPVWKMSTSADVLNLLTIIWHETTPSLPLSALINKKVPCITVPGVCQNKEFITPANRLVFHVLFQTSAGFWSNHSLINGDFLARVIVSSAGVPHLLVERLYLTKTVVGSCASPFIISSITELLRWRDWEILRNFLPVITRLGNGKL